ncbi:MAG: right-handed parallel beta-helix repeat-containing protein [Clostridia bacterium]|nr:right-handed parallel beta-helix repeat-containing protein [Clostridia bacterium]
MIYLRNTGESFSDIYIAREAVLNFARVCDPKEHMKTELVLDAGEYVLSSPLVFSKEENPELENISLSITCENGKATFTSQKALDGKRFIKNANYYTYQFEKDENGKFPALRDLYLHGERLPICRSAFFTHAFNFSEENKRNNSENLEGIYVPEEAAALLESGALGSAEITLYVEWDFFTLHVIGIDKTRTKLDEEGKKHVLLKIKPDELYCYVNGVNKYLKPLNREFFLANTPSLLTEDSWCYDVRTGVLCYKPKSGTAEGLSYAVLEKLLVFEGMDGVRIENLDFTGITDKYVPENGYISGQANVEMRVHGKVAEAAVIAKNTRRFRAEKCKFYELGAGGILATGELAMIHISSCSFENIAMSAISIGNPTSISREKENCSYDVRVENNLFRRIGYEFPSSPAIHIFRVDGVSIFRNTIEYCAYSGVSVGWLWSALSCALGELINIRDAEISHNRILHHMQLLRDGGAIYAVGGNCTVENTRFFNFMHDNFAYREDVKRTVRGYYLDGSSSNWHVYDNVVSGAQRPAFSQFIVPEQYTKNNFVENTYTTEPMDVENHCPERNVIFEHTYTEPTLEALFTKYPKARDIFEKSGCDLR